MSCEIFITSDKWRQRGEFGSLNKYPLYIGNVQRAVEGRLISCTMALGSQLPISIFYRTCQCVSPNLFPRFKQRESIEVGKASKCTGGMSAALGNGVRKINTDLAKVGLFTM
uniref:Uncharacterized protein n=1 Tax=Candidatus Kentrum eta TaxID=2126337 RepID=A0A450VG82_9GAMM|nr:MAG: hypothetical protein BECKH772B_GA0070898_103545 [Candidatus Kentron sp. H]VFK03794.1 MAG: hypothetical protein BECKH772A_GA0070896_103536 [Candidatus Kentron sp. H]VFK06803.1 MAG: hypothetical protein BECKH772C_GA0070978_103744 [Candidatus Kentron sp. H]